jgi:hypothetical protein
MQRRQQGTGHHAQKETGSAEQAEGMHDDTSALEEKEPMGIAETFDAAEAL